MRFAALVVPGCIDTPTGGYIYDRRIVEGLGDRGWSVRVVQLDGSFPEPSPEDLENARAALAAIPSGAATLVDGLALGAMADVIAQESARLRFVALVHLPLGLEVGTPPSIAERLADGERRALRSAAAVVVTGAATIDLLARRGVDPHTIQLIEPGTDRRPLARGSDGSRCHLISVGTISPGKGQDVLLEALAACGADNWTLDCVGSVRRAPAAADRLRRLVTELGFEERVRLTGELSGDALQSAYDRSDVFALATRRETYGMAVAEALACGLPVISTTTGAIPDLVGDCAGLLVEPGDVGGLSEALRRILTDANLRRGLAAGARQVRDRLQPWSAAVDRMAALLERISLDA